MQSNDLTNKVTNDSSLPLTKLQLMQATDCTASNADKYLQFIKGACKAFEINTQLRLAAFLSQIGHESGNLSAVVENLNYSKEGLHATWPNRFPTVDSATVYHRNPIRIANRVYANRMGNGDESTGDGFMYRGRGLIQLTGKEMYQRLSDEFNEDFVKNPDLLLTPIWCCISAAWYWNDKKLNELADDANTLLITRRINGGTNGLADRKRRYAKALIALKDFNAGVTDI